MYVIYISSYRTFFFARFVTFQILIFKKHLVKMLQKFETPCSNATCINRENF